MCNFSEVYGFSIEMLEKMVNFEKKDCTFKNTFMKNFKSHVFKELMPTKKLLFKPRIAENYDNHTKHLALSHKLPNNSQIT